MKIWGYDLTLFETLVGYSGTVLSILSVPTTEFRSMVYAGCADGSIRIIETFPTTLIQTYQGTAGALHDLIISNSKIYSAHGDGTIGEFDDMSSGSFTLTASFSGGNMSSAKDLKIDGGFLYSSSLDGSVTRWDLTTRSTLLSFHFNHSVNSIHVFGGSLY